MQKLEISNLLTGLERSIEHLHYPYSRARTLRDLLKITNSEREEIGQTEFYEEIKICIEILSFYVGSGSFNYNGNQHSSVFKRVNNFELLKDKLQEIVEKPDHDFGYFINFNHNSK